MFSKSKRTALISVTMAVVMSFALCPAAAFGVTAAQKKAEVQDVKEKLDAMADELEMAVDEYNAAQRSYDNATEKVESCKKKIDTAQKKIDELQTHLGTRATAMYRGGSMSYLDVLMGVGSFDDFATVWDTLNALNADDADLVSDTKEAKAELEEAKKELDDQQAQAKQSYDDAAAYKTSIEEKEAEYNELYDSLSAEYQELLEKEREERERAAAAAAAAYTPSGNATASSSSSGSSSSGSSASSSSDSDDSSSSESTSERVAAAANSGAVARAESLLGVPYVYGGASASGIDCSGLVSYALTGNFGHAYVSQDFWAMPAVSDPQPGDVVACHAGHCGLYIGDGQMIEAPHTGAVVRISAVRGKIVRP